MGDCQRAMSIVQCLVPIPLASVPTLSVIFSQNVLVNVNFSLLKFPIGDCTRCLTNPQYFLCAPETLYRMVLPEENQVVSAYKSHLLGSERRKGRATLAHHGQK